MLNIIQHTKITISLNLLCHEIKGEQKSIDRNLDLAIYKLLFDSMDAGFCIIEMYIKPNEPLDYKFIELNRAFAEQSTLFDAKGKWMRELRPDHEENWFGQIWSRSLAFPNYRIIHPKPGKKPGKILLNANAWIY